MVRQIHSNVESVRVRKRRRVLLITPVRVVVQTSVGQMALSSRLLDICDDGAAIWIGVDIPMGTRLHLEAGHVFEGKALKMSAVVRNRRKYIYGVEFLPGTEGAEDQKVRTLKLTLLSMGTATPSHLDDRRCP